MTTQAQHTPHEPGDVNARRVVIVAGSILAFVFISMAALYLVYSNLIPHRQAERPGLFPQPRLQADEAAELRRLTAQQRARLSGYHWADASHTVITIPIERAMQSSQRAEPVPTRRSSRRSRDDENRSHSSFAVSFRSSRAGRG